MSKPRHRIWLRHEGEIYTLKSLCRKLDRSYVAVRSRMTRNTHDLHEALGIEPGQVTRVNPSPEECRELESRIQKLRRPEEAPDYHVPDAVHYFLTRPVHDVIKERCVESV